MSAGSYVSDRQKELIDLALKLIRAMRMEHDAMPRQFEAPNTCDAAAILVSRLIDAGYDVDRFD